MGRLVSRVVTLFLGAPGTGMSAEDREISDSIRKLKTLRVRDGHATIDPSEVVTDAYIEDRRAARRLLSK